MKMVSMEHEVGETTLPACMPNCEYPYGLRLNLGAEQLAALGIELPKAGTEFHLEAMATVTRASTEDPDADGDIDFVCLEMQITELGVEEGGKSEEPKENPVEVRDSKAKKLYGKT